MLKRSLIVAARPQLAPFVLAFKLERQGQFWLLRMGPAHSSEYLFKAQLPFEHPWNSQIMITRKDSTPEGAQWNLIGPSGRQLVFEMKKVMGVSVYEAYVEGQKQSSKALLDEIQSRNVDPEKFLDLYLESLKIPSKRIA